MTDYHPVTREELEKLMSWSTNKSPQVCQYERRLEILKRIEARPDPLELLEKWLRVQYELSGEIDISKVRVFVKRLRTNPEAVREQGIQEGWYHD